MGFKAQWTSESRWGSSSGCKISSKDQRVGVGVGISEQRETVDACGVTEREEPKQAPLQTTSGLRVVIVLVVAQKVESSLGVLLVLK
jgi:hypothetical protein